MPLQVEKAVALAVFVRRCAGLALVGILTAPTHTLFNLDQCNRFLACRDGMVATLVNPFTGQMSSMKDWLASVLDLLRQADLPKREWVYLDWLAGHIEQHDNAAWMRQLWQQFSGDRQHDLRNYSARLAAVLLERSSALAR